MRTQGKAGRISQLHYDARVLIELARRAGRPSSDDRARIFSALMSSLSDWTGDGVSKRFEGNRLLRRGADTSSLATDEVEMEKKKP
jgi:hypothetical protein